MDGIYRVPPTVAEPPRDQGIVGEVIAQFADPFAFYRELVQNAIDAGTPSIDVDIELDTTSNPSPVVKVSVKDQGEGMSREIVEDQLLVLFRSTKENDDTKIGKFGIGFASVLSPGPNVVVVHTARDGRRLTLHLKRDLSYELFDVGPATRTGTTVELEIPLATTLDAFVTASVQALIRWCRHATVPIRVVARDGATLHADTRIDRPLGLDHALVEVRATSDDGHTTAVVGITDDAAPYAGFFDHGLTLFEDTAPLLGRIAFKVQDARLGHTLSRDNVRRDAAFHRALAFAEDVARRELPAAAARALGAAAGTVGARAGYKAVADAIEASGVRIARSSWTYPLVEPVEGSRVATTLVAGQRLLAARRPSAITAMLAGAGFQVVDLGPEGELADLVHRRFGEPSVDVHHELTRVVPVAITDVDRALLALTAELLEKAHRRPGELELAELEGGLAGHVAITGDRDDAAIDAAPYPAPWLIDRRRGGRRPFGLLGRPAVTLSVGHHQVVAARRLAHTDPVAAASLLARLLLLDAGVLDADRSQHLLVATLTALGVGASR